MIPTFSTFSMHAYRKDTFYSNQALIYKPESSIISKKKSKRALNFQIQTIPEGAINAPQR